MTIEEAPPQTPAAQHCPDCGTSESTPGRFCVNCLHLKNAPPNVKAASFGRRFGAFVLDFVLFVVTLGIGWFIWWLIVLANGQTPGKQLLSIRVIKATGEPSEWGLTFVREFVVKGLVIGFLSNFLFGIIFLVNYLLPLFDQDKQALHDKMVSTLVIKDAQPA